MKSDKVDLTPKSLAKLKIMIQYEVKPLRDRIKILEGKVESSTEKIKKLEGKIDYANRKLMFNGVE